MNGFSQSLSDAKADISGISKLVNSTKGSVKDAGTSVTDAGKIISGQSAASDLSALNSVSKEIALASGSLKAKLGIEEVE